LKRSEKPIDMPSLSEITPLEIFAKEIILEVADC
jgi:hypothetical protein